MFTHPVLVAILRIVQSLLHLLDCITDEAAGGGPLAETCLETIEKLAA
jgi:hypothetical protein